MVKYKKRLTPTCPLCPALEDAAHVWTCPSSQTQQLWSDPLVELDLWLASHDTSPDIKELIIAGLDSWRSNQPPPSSPLPNIASRQAALGWQSFFEGRPSLGWAETQEQYFKSLSSKRSGHRWLVQVLLKLSNIAWDLWEHRNGFLYKQNAALAYEKQTLLIRDAFQRKHLHNPKDARRLFSRGIQAVLQAKPHTRESWLVNVEASLASAASQEHQAARRSLNRQRQLMHSFFSVP